MSPGHVATTQDALILFEACLQGYLSPVGRRPLDRERSTLIRSGSVFIYEENTSGIKRWTDGVVWSPSRILDTFLVYRELDKPFPPGEKKRAIKKRKRRESTVSVLPPAFGRRPRDEAFSISSGQSSNNERRVADARRQLIGSLVGSYSFKADGLVKKTMTTTIWDVTYRLVSYYDVEDVMAGNLGTPSQTKALRHIRPRPELLSQQSFRSPIEEVGDVEDVHEPTRQTSPGNQYDRQPHAYYIPQLYPATLGGLSHTPHYLGFVPFGASAASQMMLHTGQIGQDRLGYGQDNDNFLSESGFSVTSGSAAMSWPKGTIYPLHALGSPILTFSPMP
ncbi:Global transcription regulator sge1 [Exophiala xenobiotica]|uniref:Global transcription regulator sge1 n=1 Tax=Lithohypha guttulata TaxID=1690604 RepID=A0ABR0JY70_9EURO|nr:Global transcription regulator sge1 [Lithohypha guttulata]KAK5309464.1 Global transcription regulator sge1 [Exophiala xenobiotica]